MKAVGRSRYAGGKRCQERQCRPLIFRHHSSVGGRQGACLAATGSWAACSPSIGHAELRRLKTVPSLGPASRRSALRKNRRLVSAEMIMAADATKEIQFEIGHVLFIDIVGYSNGRTIWIADAHRGDGGSNAMFRPKRAAPDDTQLPSLG